MDIAVLLLLPLVGGYIFANNWIATKVVLAREDGYRLYFRAAFWGVALFAMSLAIHTLLISYCDWYRNWLSEIRILATAWFKEPNSVDLAIVAVWAMLIAYPFARFLNRISPRYGRKVVLDAIYDNDIERILHNAAIKRRPIAITMANKKVYIGFLLRTPDPTKLRRSIGVLPLVSGYRSDTDGKLSLTTYYTNIYGSDAHPAETGQQKLPPPLDHLSPEDFEIVLPLELVQSISLFDLTAYREFQRRGPQGARTNQHKSGDS